MKYTVRGGPEMLHQGQTFISKHNYLQLNTKCDSVYGLHHLGLLRTISWEKQQVVTTYTFLQRDVFVMPVGPTFCSNKLIYDSLGIIWSPYFSRFIISLYRYVILYTYTYVYDNQVTSTNYIELCMPYELYFNKQLIISRILRVTRLLRFTPMVVSN